MKPIHILNQLGVMTSFSVAKKVTEEDMEKYFVKHKKEGRSEEEISAMLHNKILHDIQDAIRNNEIPGLISVKEMAQQYGLKPSIMERIPELNKLGMILAQKLSEKNYDKMSLCYFINYLVNVLGLTEQDFEKFHRQKDDKDDDDGSYRD